MCGRFALLATAADLVDEFDVERIIEVAGPRYNIAPTQTTPVVCRDGNETVLRCLRWGLIPSWAKDASIGNKLINARAESVAEKPSFRAAFKQRRCLVAASGFFEWKKAGGRKVPMYVKLNSGKPFGFAGLWEQWSPREDPSEPVHTFTIITCEPNDLLKSIHDRMPVIIPREKRALWLDAAAAPAELRSLLAPYPAEELTAHGVSPLVNSPANNSPECIRPV